MTTSLNGKTILALELATDKKAILFHTDQGDVKALCDGDCCSDTWVEHISLPFKGFPAKVEKVTDQTINDGGELVIYGCTIFTDKGEIVIDYRNESNGYYGGNLHWPDDGYFYGGVFGQNKSSEEWQPFAVDA